MSDYRGLIPEFARRSDRVKRITRALNDHFGINYFYYYRLDAFGNLSLLTDHPDIDEYYFAEKMFLTDPYLKHPNHYRTGFFSMEAYGSEEYKEDQKKIFGTFNILPCVSLIIQNSDSFDFFGFLRVGSGELPNYHFNHLHLLKSFAIHFKEEFETVLLEMEKASFSILELVGNEQFYSGIPIFPTMERDNLRAFLKKMGLEGEILKFDSLTKREQQCLKALTNGKTAKETAIELNLSSRTIEHYLENCKLKLSCWNKWDLFSIGGKFQEIGLL